MKDTFIKAIHEMKKIRITYRADKYESESITRLCAPTDFAPSKRPNVSDKSELFHFWDYESPSKPHITSKLPKEVTNIEITDIDFLPSDFIKPTWKLNWTISRDWGQFS